MQFTESSPDVVREPELLEPEPEPDPDKPEPEPDADKPEPEPRPGSIVHV